MEIMSVLFFLVMIVYSILILWMAFGMKKVSLFVITDHKPKTRFSIVVPFRNEAKNLPDLLYSFSQLQYPRDLFEVVFVDDGSDDDSVATLKNFPALSFAHQIVSNQRHSHSPKKDAITTAVRFAKYDWILTTDADCFVSSDWLKTLDQYIQKNQCEMVVGAVSFEAGTSFLHHFQQLDLMALQGATIGSFGIGKPFMCNGANFGYTKNLFQELGGFEGNNTVASGDDVFLLQKAIQRFPEKVAYVKSLSNIVMTKSVTDWKTLLHQRVRWASKASAYQSGFGKALALVVFAGNLVVVLGLLMALLGRFAFWDWYLLFAVKIFADFILLYQTGKFIQNFTVRYYILSNLLYPFFSVLAGFYALRGRYEWKGRVF